MPDPLTPDPSPSPDPVDQQQTFDVDGALKALQQSGLSPDDAESKVLDHLSHSVPFNVNGAMAAGASKRQIIDHLASQPPAPVPPTIPGTEKTGLPPIASQPNGAMDVLRNGTQFGPLASQNPPSVQQIRQSNAIQQEHQQFQRDHPILSTATQVLGSGLPMPATMEMGSVADPSALALGRAIVARTRAAFKPDPTRALVKVYSPTPSDSGFSDRLPETIPSIAAASPEPITGNEHVITATKNALNANQDHFENAWLAPARARGVQIPGDSIAKASVDAIPSSLWREDPASAQAIVNRANNAYSKQSLTTDQLRQLLREKNADLDAFYAKAEGKQNASIISGDPQAIVEAQRNEIADLLYKALDPENAGAGPRQIQSQYGDMKDILNAALRKRNAIIKEKPVTTAGAIGKVAAGMFDLPGKILHGDVEGGINNLRNARYGASDPLIADIFKKRWSANTSADS